MNHPGMVIRLAESRFGLADPIHAGCPIALGSNYKSHEAIGRALARGRTRCVLDLAGRV